MPLPTGRARWTLGGAFFGVALLSWLGSIGAGRIVQSKLALPKGAAVSAIEPAAEPTAPTVAGPLGEAPGSELAAGAAGGPSSRAPTRVDATALVDAVVRRNIFDSAAVAGGGEGGANGADGPTDPSAFDGSRKSDLKVVLLATLVADPASFSSALIAEEKGAGARGYGEGDDLIGEATVLRIDFRKVYLRRSDGSVEYIAMEDGKSFKKDAAAKDEKDDGAGDGITKDGGKIIVDKALIDEITANPEKLYSEIRAVPHKGSDGQVDGYRLSGIRKKSIFSQLGIKNGDIVHTVNGKPLTSMSAAMDAYNSLSGGASFNFEITRRNQRQTQEYEVR